MENSKILQVKKSQQGVVLLEALIAILIFSVGILSLVGLQASMTKSTSSTKMRGDASYIAQQRIGAMWANPANASTLVESNTDISNLMPGGKRTVTNPSPGMFRVTVGWTEPGETPASDSSSAPCFMPVSHCYTTLATIVDNS